MQSRDDEVAQAVRKALSLERMRTYEQMYAAEKNGCNALALYLWNAQISSAFLAPLHIFEVVVRNAVSEALITQYGERWPWSPGFEQSLPDPKVGYSQRKDLKNARCKHQSTGKVIPDLTFAFWQKMFTRRFDTRLWSQYLKHVFPNADALVEVTQLRENIFNEMDNIRKLRNRIAHHEPIFKRVLDDDYQTIKRVISLRCTFTSEWMDAHQQVRDLMQCSPIKSGD